MYIIVENAGHEGERDAYSTNTYRDAITWLRQNYTNEEQQTLHVNIRRTTTFAGLHHPANEPTKSK